LSLGNFAMFFSLPSAAELPAIAECPSVHAFLVYPTTSSSLRVWLPKEYWAIKVPRKGLPGTYKSVAALACASTERLTGEVTFSPGLTNSEALLIATSDSSAAPFNVKLVPSQ
jgi:hypothetical protein